MRASTILRAKSVDVQNWLNAEAYDDLKQPPHEEDGHHGHHHCHGHDHDHDDHCDSHGHSHTHDPNRHDDRITAVSYTLDQPISAAEFQSWLEKLVLACGPDLLRLKAIVHVEGVPKPFVIHGVQHVFHPPIPLMDWPEDDRKSRIVVIGRDISEEFLKDHFGMLDLITVPMTGDGHHHHKEHGAQSAAH